MPTPARRTSETVDLDRLNKKWSTYREPAEKPRWVHEYSTMVRHTQGRIDPLIILARRPNEPKRVYEYRKKQFRAITKSPMNRAINSLQRIFANSSVSITWPDRATDLFEVNSFQDCTFLGYINKHVVRRMIEDPNGLLLWWANVPGAANERAVPEPILVLSENIMHLTEEMLIVKSDEKSPVTKYDGERTITVNEGLVWLVVTKYGYYKRVQYGQQGKQLFKIVNGYAHQFGYLPYVVLGGEEMMANDAGKNTSETWLASYFEPCTQYADEALHQFSDWQSVMVNSAHPIQEMERMKCPNTECRKGKITVVSAKGRSSRKDCPSCNGEGFIVPKGPWGQIFRRQKKAGIGEELMSDPVPAIRYLHADPAILEQIEKAWRELMKDVEKALHLLFVDEAQSGVAKEKDREDKVSTLDRIGQNVYGVVVMNSVEICLGLMNIGGKANLTLPDTFQVRTEEEIRLELKDLQGDGVIPLYKAEAFKELIRKRFPSDLVMHKIADVLVYVDPGIGYNASEKAAMVAQGLLSEEVVKRATLAPWLLRRLATDIGQEQFLEKSVSDLAKLLDPLIDKELAARPVVTLPPANAAA